MIRIAPGALVGGFPEYRGVPPIAGAELIGRAGPGKFGGHRPPYRATIFNEPRLRWAGACSNRGNSWGAFPG